MGISIGIVGLGSFGSVFVDLFKSHPLVDRIALCDLEPSRVKAFAEKPSMQDKLSPKDCYTSLDEICKSDLDALAIITQHWLHAPQAVQALEAGKHVYSAVPVVMLPSSDEIIGWCDKIVNTSKKTGLHYMLGETTYYRPQTMFCRRKAKEGAFGDFVYGEGEYFHDVDAPECNLRDVMRMRTSSKAGQEWLKISKKYVDKGILSGPMHYPTHSTSGPISVMNAHMTKVSAFGYRNRNNDPFFAEDSFSNETALFLMSNGATVRICEYREIGYTCEETFRIFGTKASFNNDIWVEKGKHTPVSVEEMRDPLPEEVVRAFSHGTGESDFYGGHGGSHAYLVHEFVDAIAHERMPAINAWLAARFMAAGAMAHKSALRGGEMLDVPDWGDPPK